MQITNLIIDAGRHARDIVRASRLGQADRAKFSRSEIFSLVHDNVLLGRINVCEAILKGHTGEPYGTVDELIGDLQILLVESNNQLLVASNQNLATGRLQKLNINDLVGVWDVKEN